MLDKSWDTFLFEWIYLDNDLLKSQSFPFVNRYRRGQIWMIFGVFGPTESNYDVRFRSASILTLGQQ